MPLRTSGSSWSATRQAMQTATSAKSARSGALGRPLAPVRGPNLIRMEENVCLDPTMHATPAKVVGAFHSTQKLRFDLRASSLSAVRDGLLPPGYTEKERFSWVHDSS